MNDGRMGAEADDREKYMPKYIQHDIRALEEGLRTHSTVLDCLYNELQGSINSAYYDNEITMEDAAYLRRKYLDMGE